MWTIKWYGDATSRKKSIIKKNEHETLNVLDNLDTLHIALCAGTKPEQLKNLRFVRSEPSGILAIDQRGPGKGTRMKQLRLYVYPDESDAVLHVMTFGNKSTQKEDIRLCKGTVAEIVKQKAKAENQSDA